MEDLLTTRQVLDILKVDRITVYRMLQDGRLKGVKIGQQWRFPQSEVERLLGSYTSEKGNGQKDNPSIFPIHCVQTIQDLFSAVGQMSAMVVDNDGNPVTDISQSCRFCQIMLQNPAGLAACRASWKEIAQQSSSGIRYFNCHAGLQYISAPIKHQEDQVGCFLAGQFYWQPPDHVEETERVRRLTSQYSFKPEMLQQATRTIPVIAQEQHKQVETWPTSAARAIRSILHERVNLMSRLQQITNLTKFS
jgi:excisionase family DNA binding protein